MFARRVINRAPVQVFYRNFHMHRTGQRMMTRQVRIRRLRALPLDNAAIHPPPLLRMHKGTRAHTRNASAHADRDCGEPGTPTNLRSPRGQWVVRRRHWSVSVFGRRHWSSVCGLERRSESKLATTARVGGRGRGKGRGLSSHGWPGTTTPACCVFSPALPGLYVYPDI